MTTLLQQAFDEASKLSPAEQNLLASWLLAELAGEDAFDCTITRTAGKLVGLSKQAIDEHRAGLTEELNPEKL